MSKLLSEVNTAVKLFILMSVLTGILYTTAISYVSNEFFPFQAGGSIIYKQEKAVASLLIGQKFTSNKYFWSRPSAIDYQALPSGASNLSPTSQSLRAIVNDRKTLLMNAHPKQKAIPGDLLSASASGLDPHISLKALQYQIGRVIEARKLNLTEQSKLKQLIDNHLEARDLGVLGEERINVLALNLALDKNFRL